MMRPPGVMDTYLLRGPRGVAIEASPSKAGESGVAPVPGSLLE